MVVGPAQLFEKRDQALFCFDGKEQVETNLKQMKAENHSSLRVDTANEKNVNFSFFAEIIGRCKKQIIGSGIKPGATTVPQVQGLKFVSDPAFQHLM